MLLSANSKNIIINRMIDRNIQADFSILDNYLINPDNFNSYNDMYEYIINNFGQLEII